jgi:hypothetical protein
MTIDAARLWQIRDQLPPAKSWQYTHDGQATDVTVALGATWPAIRVEILVHGTGLRTIGDFAGDGRLHRLTIETTTETTTETTSDAIEISVADLRKASLLGSLKQWEVVGRRYAHQILDGVPEREISVDGLSATQALRALAWSPRQRPVKRARGSRREDLLRQVADAYREAIDDGDPAPRTTLATRFGYSPAHIGRLLVAARRERNGQPPLLGPAHPGRAGETATP